VFVPIAESPRHPDFATAANTGSSKTGITIHRTIHSTTLNQRCTEAGRTGRRILSVSHDAMRNAGVAL